MMDITHLLTEEPGNMRGKGWMHQVQPGGDLIVQDFGPLVGLRLIRIRADATFGIDAKELESLMGLLNEIRGVWDGAHVGNGE